MWLAIGLVLGAVLAWLAMWLCRLQIPLRWHDWLIYGSGLALLLVALENFSASLAEFEPAAAWNSLFVLGSISLMLMALGSFLVWRRARRPEAGGPR